MRSLLFLLVLLTGVLLAQSTPTLKKVQDTYKNAAGFEAQIEVAGLPGGGTGKLYYKKENKTRVDFKNLLIVTDGKTTWNIQKAQKKAIISDYDEQDASLLTFYKIMTYYPSVSDVTESVAEGKPQLVFIPKKKNTHFSKIECILNDDNTFRKITMYDRGGNKQTIMFSGWKLKAPDEQFFTPGDLKGVKVIDLR